MSPPTLTVILYKVGEFGDHNSGESTVNWNALFVLPVAVVLTFVEPGSYTVISTGVLVLPELWTVTLTSTGQYRVSSKRMDCATFTVHVCAKV